MVTAESLLPCRLMVEGPDRGARQMAVDEVLLESAARQPGATLRFYRWSEPTLSLGYFQAYAERDAHLASRDCIVVRRQTGGGAILHDRELTYSLAIPRAHPLAEDATRLYEAVHEALVRVLAAHGLAASRCTESHSAAPATQPFLCFQRRMRGDVLLGGVKICGSAQRRRRGAILQHGSLLLARSPYAPELSGILETGKMTTDTMNLAADWAREIGRNLSLALISGDLSPAEREAVRRLEGEKYAHALWIRRR